MYEAPQGLGGNSRLKGVKKKIRSKLIYADVCVVVRVCTTPRRDWLVTPVSRGLKEKYVESLWMCVSSFFVSIHVAPQGFVGNSRLKGVKIKIRQKLIDGCV
jgi:hypothetical protein